MTSIFSLRCAQCDGELLPAWGAVWTCARCDTMFEVCGRYLVPVIAERDRAQFLRLEHQDAVDTDGSANTRGASSVTEHGSATSPS